MYSSYRGKNEKVVKSSIIIPLINSGTSLLAGMILFGLLGHMAYQKGIDIGSLPLQGPGMISTSSNPIMILQKFRIGICSLSRYSHSASRIKSLGYCILRNANYDRH